MIGAPSEARAQPTDSFEALVGQRYAAASAITVRVDRLVRGRRVSRGSGVIVSSRGLVVTAGHVVSDRNASYRVIFPDGRRARVRRVHRHPVRDLALLRTGVATSARVEHRGEPRRGEWIVCSGFIAPAALARTLGVVAETDFPWTIYESTTRSRRPRASRTLEGTLRIGCPGGRGMSGGPVLDLRGALLGIYVGAGIAESVETLVAWAGDDLDLPMAERGSLPGSLPTRDRSRAATLLPRFGDGDDVQRSVVVLEREDGRQFHGVVASDSGHVVTVAEAIGDSSSAPLRIPSQPEASMAEIVDVAGELVLLRYDGLLARSVGHDAASLEVGDLIVTVSAGPGYRSVGVVGDTDHRPGRVQPQPRLGGCRTMRNRWSRAHPAVELTGAVLHHDASPEERGALLVDRQGRPAAVHIVSAAAGAGYAVSWREVLRRFPDLRLR